MQYLWQHLENILSVYDGRLPLHHFLKGYFKANPKLGSRDRKGLNDAVYSWHRVGKALNAGNHSIQLRRLAAMQACGTRPKAFISFFPEEWQWPVPTPGAPVEVPNFHIQVRDIFPYDIRFSEGITADEWRSSMLHQPRLFLRIRRRRAEIERQLISAGIPQEWISETCLALPNGIKLDGLLKEDDYVVQDASSQATGAYLHGSSGEHWWDCCSGAGGKSLMLADASKGIQLLASDVRESILQNLTARFRLYHLPAPERLVLNTSDAHAVAKVLGSRQFEGIVCDVPCSGSGTWARTPETCYFFQLDTLEVYTNRQLSILRNAANYLAVGGRIVYITCSVFRAENEDVINAVSAEAGLAIDSSRLINGISIEADSLFVAVLRKV